MDFLVERIFWGKSYTIGRLYLTDVNKKEFICDTLEDRVVDVNKNGVFDKGEQKVYGKTAIPFGKYTVLYNWSPKFKAMYPRLMNVPHFEGILIHGGVDETHTDGCILVGYNEIKGKLINSSQAMKKIRDLFSGPRGKEKHSILVV